MPTAAPLQLLLFRDTDDRDALRYEEAVVRAFQGGKEAGGYLATGEDLGIQLEVFSTAPGLDAEKTLDSFCHTLTVVLVDRSLLDKSGDALWDWLAKCWVLTNASKGRHAMLAIPMDERIGREFSTKRPELGNLQLLQVTDLGEYAIRPAMLALRLLHEGRVLLAGALPSIPDHKPGYLRLFISHAKIDGLPLAHALKHQIEALGWLQDFYDVDDLPGGCDWQAELERGVGSSLIVMLRTEVYDSRPWCQQEVLWADEYATPAVLVDARTGLNHPASVLPLDRVPTVRIPDGNLLRILFLALREGLRFLLFKRRVEQMKESGSLSSKVGLRVFSFPPSMSTLLRACRDLTDSKRPSSAPSLILYPDPPLRAGSYEAANALVATYAPSDTRLVTPNTLAATKGATP
ncbi:MAG: TIR domain-containing protein [Candidatus Acidiferrales bacterium]